MTPDLHDDLTELASRLPDPPPSSVSTVAERARRRGRRRVGLTAAVVVVVLAIGAALIGSLTGVNDTRPVAPRIDTLFGPAIIDVGLCPPEVPECPDLPPADAVDKVTDVLGRYPHAHLIEILTDPATSPTPGVGDAAGPSSQTVRVRLERTSAVDQLLRELLSLPAVFSVSIGSADQPPSDIELPLDGTSEPGELLSRFEVPVANGEPVVFEIRESHGAICYGAREFMRCGQLAVTRGSVGGANGPIDENTTCATALTGPGVDHVRMGFTDGTLLELASTPLHPALPVIELHAACWKDSPSNAIVEIIAPDGTVIDRSPVDVPLPAPSP